MNMLVSDYDKTFDGITNDGRILNLKLNCESVKKFIEQGNIFVLASSVDYETLTQFANENEIPYSYLMGRDGICDHNQNLLLSCNSYDSISREIGIMSIKNMVEIDDNDIFTVGDDEKDLSMIATWNGFQIGDNEQLSKFSLGKYDDVYKLVGDIIKEKVKKRKCCDPFAYHGF